MAGYTYCHRGSLSPDVFGGRTDAGLHMGLCITSTDMPKAEEVISRVRENQSVALTLWITVPLSNSFDNVTN